MQTKEEAIERLKRDRDVIVATIEAIHTNYERGAVGEVTYGGIRRAFEKELQAVEEELLRVIA